MSRYPMSYPYEPREQDPPGAWSEGLRRAAVVGWVSFIGAVCAMPLLLWVDQVGLHGLGELTVGFVLAWLLCVIPASLALLLARRPGRDRRSVAKHRDGRAP